MTPESAVELTEAVARWVRRRGECRALAIVGSRARGDPQPDSDLDLLVLVNGGGRQHSAARSFDGIDFKSVGFAVIARRAVRYGAVLSHHLELRPAGEIELSFASLDWAATNPIDAGTSRVVRGGFRSIVDKDGCFGQLLAALDPRPAISGSGPVGDATA